MNNVSPISQHPSEDLLIEYSAGSLNASLSLCVSVHVEYCEQCRKQLHKLNALAGAMFEQQTPAPVNPVLLDNIFDRIDSQMVGTAGQEKIQLHSQGDLPTAINKAINYDKSQLKWRRHGRKVKSAKLMSHQGINSSLIHIQKGAAIPQHTHKGSEYTIVLKGQFSDDAGVYHAGDFIKCDDLDTHSPTATADADCICLIAMDGPLKFSNPLMQAYNLAMPL